MSETESAIAGLEDLVKRTDFELSLIDKEFCDEADLKVLESYEREKGIFTLAITALRAQSEEERKIEKVREYCKTIKQQMLIDACTLGYQGACREILEILEGAERISRHGADYHQERLKC